MPDYNPRLSNTSSYAPPPLRPTPTVFPTTQNYGSPPSGGGGLFSGISSLMGGPAGIALGGISAIGNMLQARAQRKEAARQFNTSNAIGDNQFAAQFGLNRDQQWFDKQGQLYDRERYAANQNNKLPMLQALVSRLGGIAGAGGLAGVAAPSMDGVRGAGNASLGAYTPFTANKTGKVTSASQYRNG